MLPKVTELEIESAIEEQQNLPPIGKSFLYDFDKGDFVIRDGKMIELHGVEALKMWITKVLKTERFRFRIYDGVDYGVTLEDLIGSIFPRSFIEAEIKREVSEALLRHPHINSITEWAFERNGKWMKICFRVNTNNDAFDMEVNR